MRREIAEQKDANRLTDDQPRQYQPCGIANRRKLHTGIHQTKQEQHDLHRIFQRMFQHVQHIGQIAFRLGKDTKCPIRVGDGRNDRQQAQRWMQAAFLKAIPRDTAGNDIGQTAQQLAHLGGRRAILFATVQLARHPVEQEKHRQGRPDRQQQPLQPQLATGVIDRQNDQSRRIIGNRQQQKEPHRRVTGAKDDPPDKV